MSPCFFALSSQLVSFISSQASSTLIHTATFRFSPASRSSKYQKHIFIYNSAIPTVTLPTSTTHIAAPKAPFSTGDSLPAALFPLALALGLALIVLEEVAEAGIDERAEAWVYVAVRPVALVHADGTEVAEPATKFTAAHCFPSR